MLLVLLIFSSLFVGSLGQSHNPQSCASNSQAVTLAPLPIKASYPDEWVAVGDGASVAATQLNLKCVVGGSCAVWFPHRISILAGAEFEFDYNVPSTGGASNGFAFVIQQQGTSARDGSYHRLGYNIQRAIGIEFDYLADAQGETSSNVPHSAVFSGSSVSNSYLPDPKYDASRSMNLASICAAGTTCRVNIRILRFTPNPNQIVIEYKVKDSAWVRSTVPVPQVSGRDPYYGEVFVGFTASTGNAASAGSVITNYKMSTAVARVIGMTRSGASQPVVTASVTSSNFYSVTLGSCAHEMKYMTYETRLTIDSMKFTPIATATECVSENLVRAASSSDNVPTALTHRSFGCKRPVYNKAIFKVEYKDHSGATYTHDLPVLSIAAGSPDARYSSITHIDGTAFNPSTTPTFEAGNTHKFTVLLKDQYENNAYWGHPTRPSYDVSIRIPAGDVSQSGGGRLQISESSTVDVNVLMEKQTNGASVIELNVLGVLARHDYKAIVRAGPAHHDTVALAGSQTTQYAAGATITVDIALFDRYTNPLKAESAADLANMALSITATGDNTACKAQNDANFVTCPSVSVTSAGNARITAVPKKATTFVINCSIGGVACKNVQNTMIQVVPAVEHAPSSVFAVTPRAGEVGVDYRGVSLSVYDQYKNLRTNPNTTPFSLTLTSKTNEDITTTFNCASASNTVEIEDHSLTTSCAFTNGVYAITIRTTYSDIAGYTLQLGTGTNAPSTTVYFQATVPTTVEGINVTSLPAGNERNLIGTFKDEFGNIVRELPGIALENQVAIWGVMTLTCTGGPGSSMTVDRSFTVDSNANRGAAKAQFRIVGSYRCNIALRRDAVGSFTIPVVPNNPFTLVQGSHTTQLDTNPTDSHFTFRSVDEYGNASDKLTAATLTLREGSDAKCQDDPTVTCTGDNCQVQFTAVQPGTYACEYPVTVGSRNIGTFKHSVFQATQREIFISATPFANTNKDTTKKSATLSGASGTIHSLYVIAYEDNSVTPIEPTDLLFNFFKAADPDTQLAPMTYEIDVVTSPVRQIEIKFTFGEAGNFDSSIIFRGSTFSESATGLAKVTLKFATTPGAPHLDFSTFDFAPSVAGSVVACSKVANNQAASLLLRLVDSYGNRIELTNAQLAQFPLKCEGTECQSGEFEDFTSALATDDDGQHIAYRFCHSIATRDSVLVSVTHQQQETPQLSLAIRAADPVEVQPTVHDNCIAAPDSEACICRAGVICEAYFNVRDEYSNLVREYASSKIQVALVPSLPDGASIVGFTFDDQGLFQVRYRHEQSGAYKINIKFDVMDQASFDTTILPEYAPSTLTVRRGGQSIAGRTIPASMSTTDTGAQLVFVFDFKDSFGNTWLASDVGDVSVSYDISGIRATTSFSDTVPVVVTNKRIDSNKIFSLTHHLTRAGSYRLNANVRGTRLSVISFTLSPGAPTAFEVLSVPYHPVTVVDTTVSFTIRATDEQGNNVNDDATIIPLVEAFKFDVFSGTTVSCTNNNFSATPMAQDKHGFTIKKVEHSGNSVTINGDPVNDNAYTVEFSTTIANDYSGSGIRNTYSYYVKAGSNILTCFSRHIITFLPGPFDITKSSIEKLPTKAIEAGSSTEMEVILRDKYSNVIRINDDAIEHTFSVFECDGTTAITPEKHGANGDMLAYSITLDPETAQNVSKSLAFSVQVEEVNGGDTKTEFIPISDDEDAGTCFNIPIYHSKPVDYFFDPSEALDTIGGDYLVNAGTPFKILLQSHDAYGNVVDYSNPAFGGKPETYAVNNFYYRVRLAYAFALKFDEDGKVIQDDNESDLAASGFSISNSTSIDVKLAEDAQEAFLLVPWAGRYSVSIDVIDSKTGATIVPYTQGNFGVRSYVMAHPAFCPFDQYRDVASGNCVAVPTTAPTFTCNTDPTTVSTVTPATVNRCACYDGMTKCPGTNMCVQSTAQCPSADVVVPPRVCPIGHHLCRDLYTCVDDRTQCPTRAAQCPTGQVACQDQTCVDNIAECGSVIQCPSDYPFLCPNNRCVNGEAIKITKPDANEDEEEDSNEFIVQNYYCEALRPCMFPSSYRCPLDGSCVESKEQCSRPITCPEGSVLCANNQCVLDADECGQHPICMSKDARFLCPDGTCVHDITFCSTRVSCGTTAPFLCPDQSTCVADPQQCTVARSCPIDRPYACSTGDCVEVAAQCPTATTCPRTRPIRCADNRCVESKTQCNSATNTECPHTTPVRCSDNSCVSHINLCPTPVTCPVYRPVRCANGECQSSTETCPDYSNGDGVDPSVCSRFGYVTCPLTGYCVPHTSFCPTVRKCRTDEIRCPTGICVSIYKNGAVDPSPCPVLSGMPRPDGNPPRANLCPDNLVQCPIANAGIVCAENQESCPGDIVCPPTAPVRCGDQTCRSAVEECAYVADTTTYPTTRTPCGDGSWAASAALCGRPTTCPPNAPVKCADTTCRVTPEDCPPVSECPRDRPFKCADGSCQISPWSCSISVCQGDRRVRCPTATGNRCVKDIADCPSILDMNTVGTFNVKSTFGTQCSDGSSVFEHRLCPARSCPMEAPYLCDNGACARSVQQCPATNSCPFDQPFFCPKVGKCVTSEVTCDNVIVEPCGTIEDIDPETGEKIQLQMLRCADGICRHPDECYAVTHFGCPFDAPIRCADGTCAPIPTMTGSDTIIRCKAASDAYNTCPPERPVRCRGGLCAASLSRCPVHPVSGDKLSPCRRVIIDDEDSSDDPVQMMVTCDDGSCAFSYAECPIVKPCQSNEYRCPDGSCKALPCNPRSAECRNRSTFTIENHLGAQCSGANTCPTTRPFRCQDGTCAEHVSQCLDQYPIVLGRCCGNDFYSAGADGNSVGSCVPSTGGLTCSENIVRDGSRTGGCPASSTRCQTGFCAVNPHDESFSPQALCTAYGEFFTTFNDVDEEACPHRCANGLCVESEDACPVSNGCPAATPIKCASNGTCVADENDCTEEECAGVVCPGTKICVEEAAQCTLPNGCPAATPILCANGECRKFATSAAGATFHAWNRSAPNGIDTSESCPLTVSCDALHPFVCFDGSCAVSSQYCPPVFNTCAQPTDPSLCAVVCPFSLECKTVTRDADTGACNYGEMKDVCALATCPFSTPYICPDGSCKKSVNECREVIYDAARTFECPTAQPFRCFNGQCASKPFECVAMTAKMNHGVDIEQSLAITNTNVCQGGYVCPNGLCVDPNNPQCDVLPACPFNSLRCWDGTCARASITPPENAEDEPTIAAPECPPMENACTGGTVRCADGTCRARGTCPVYNGCPLSKPFSCTWRPEKMCTDSFTACHGFSPASSMMNERNALLSASMSQTANVNKKYFANHLGLTNKIYAGPTAVDMHVNNVLNLMKTDRLKTVQFIALNSAVPRPDATTVLTCYENCERDVTVRPQSLLVTPHQELTIDVAVNANNLARTQLTIKPATFANRTEVRIHAVPQVLFDGTKSDDSVIDFAVPSTFKRPRNENNIRTSDVTGKYGATVISSPFSCELKHNSTIVKPLNTISVTSHVDLTRYDSSGGTGPVVTETDFGCELQGRWDSAFGQCTGFITIQEDILRFEYDDCEVPALNNNPGYTYEGKNVSFNATFVSSTNPGQWSDLSPYSDQKVCFQVFNSTRSIPTSDETTTQTLLRGKTLCWDFVRDNTILNIYVPPNFLSNEHITMADVEAFNAAAPYTPDRSSGSQHPGADTLANALLSSTATCASSDASDARIIRMADICLGYYSQDYEWQCLLTSYEERIEFPAWVDGMKPNTVRGGVGMDCSESAYAFLYVPLPPPTEIEDSFCFWCKYGWIILLCCILFGVILVIAILLFLKFSRDRVKFKEEQARLKDLQERAKELDEFAGGVGIADADGEIQMVANPLVLQMQELNKQLEEANNKLQTTSKQEEYEIQRLEQQRQRIYAEIARVDAELKAQNRDDDKPRRVDNVGPAAPAAPIAPAGSAVPAGPIRAGGPTPAGPTSSLPASGPMAAPKRD